MVPPMMGYYGFSAGRSVSSSFYMASIRLRFSIVATDLSRHRRSMRSGLLSPLSPWACRRRKPRATGTSVSSGTASGAQHIAHKKLAVGVHTSRTVPNFF